MHEISSDYHFFPCNFFLLMVLYLLRTAIGVVPQRDLLRRQQGYSISLSVASLLIVMLYKCAFTSYKYCVFKYRISELTLTLPSSRHLLLATRQCRFGSTQSAAWPLVINICYPLSTSFFGLIVYTSYYSHHSILKQLLGAVIL